MSSTRRATIHAIVMDDTLIRHKSSTPTKAPTSTPTKARSSTSTGKQNKKGAPGQASSANRPRRTRKKTSFFHDERYDSDEEGNDLTETLEIDERELGEDDSLNSEDLAFIDDDVSSSLDNSDQSGEGSDSDISSEMVSGSDSDGSYHDCSDDE